MIYAVGDIHGHIDKLRDAHAAIREDMARQNVEQAPIIHMGDLCDRGPATKDVVQYLIDGIARGEDWQVLKGNHDHLFINFIAGGGASEPRLRGGVTWLDSVMGGRATLASYGVRKSVIESVDKFTRRAQAAVPGEHLEFLKTLPLWIRAEGMIFVHAGIRPGFPIEAQDEEDLLWIRDEFLWHLGDHEALIVHGHTPVDEPTHYGNRVNIDTGAGWGNALIPVVFEGGACFALRDGGREQLSIPKHRPKQARQG